MSDSASTLITEAAKVAAQQSVDASVTAQEVLSKATEVIASEKERQVDDDNRIKNVLVDALNQVFGEKEKQQQFINISRVPMICQQIQEIHKNIETMSDTLSDFKNALVELELVKKIVYAVCGAVGLAIVGEVLSLISRK